MELSSLSRAMGLGYNMSALTHFSQHWSKSGPRLAKAQGLVMATLSKHREKSKHARRSENVEGDIFVGMQLDLRTQSKQPSSAEHEFFFLWVSGGFF